MSSKKRRHFTAAKKAEIVRRHLADKVAVSDLADEFGSQQSESEDRGFSRGGSSRGREPVRRAADENLPNGVRTLLENKGKRRTTTELRNKEILAALQLSVKKKSGLAVKEFFVSSLQTAELLQRFQFTSTINRCKIRWCLGS